MRNDRDEKRKADTCAGVSEIVGAIMLVSIVALLVAVVGVFLFSQPVPQKIPNLNFMTGVDSGDTSKLYIYHNGGDTLTKGEFKVLLDGKETSYSVSGGDGNQWSLGRNLIVKINPSTMPQSVQIVYNNTASSGGTGSTGSVLLDQASVNIVSSVTASPDQIPYLDCSAVRNWACRFEIPEDIIKDRYKFATEAKRVSFMKQQSAGGLVGGGTPPPYFSVNINNTNMNSKIVVTSTGANCGSSDTTKQLLYGDNLKVSFESSPSFFILYGMSPQIWELAGGKAWINITNNSGNQYTSGGSGDYICHTFVEEYSNLASTLVIKGYDSKATQTNLVVNGTTVISGSNKSVIYLNNFAPTQTDVFLIESVSSGQSAVYFIGWPNGGISIDGNTYVGGF